VEGGVCRLKSVEKRIFSKMPNQTVFDNAFSKFREKREVGDRPVVRKGVLVEVLLFKERSHKRFLEVRWKNTGRKREINDVGNDGSKDRDTVFENGCWYGVKKTLFVWRFQDKLSDLRDISRSEVFQWWWVASRLREMWRL